MWALPAGVKGDSPIFVDTKIGTVPAAGRNWDDEASRWLADAATAGGSLGAAFETIAWVHALPGLAGSMTADAWWGLLAQLVAVAVEAERLVPEEGPLVHALLAGELPLTLAYLFPEIVPCRRLAKPGCHAASASLIDLTDGAGLVHVSQWEVARPLLACWTRCRALGIIWKKGRLADDAIVQYDWAVHQALQWTRPDGRQTLADGPAGQWCPGLFEAALRLDADEDDRAVAALVLPGGKKSDAQRAANQSLPEPAVHSEWAAAAVLRPGWNRAHPVLSIHYPGTTVRCELSAKRDVLLSGPWTCEVRQAGRLLAPASEWEEVCWVSDEDADYLELEIELDEGLLVQRQMVMARKDRFLLLVDSVLGEEPAGLEYTGSLALAPDVAFDPARETREGALVADNSRRAAMVLPLALGEWRADGGNGSLESTPQGLALRQVTDGRSLCAALFLDLDPKRFERKLTWRKLTVAESLVVQPDDAAVGYRVRIGKEQWLYYRSLALPANRTVLGHNLATETLVARFHAKTGQVESVIEVA
ncbi:MAG: hypothetical protein JW809_03865 [Pirellulales bacterium]|nr:hypothetical protein [Pirellulales bacterium]